MEKYIESLNHEEKQWLAYAIAGMICADGRLDPSEEVYLREAISFLEDREQINDLVTKVKKREIGTLPATQIAGEKAFNMLKHLARISIIDGKMSPSEVRYFNQVGGLLGLPEKILETIVGKARHQLEASRPIIGVSFHDEIQEVPVLELTEEICHFRYNRAIMPHTRISLHFYNQADRSASNYDPVIVQVQRSVASKKDANTFMVRSEFQHKITPSHGVLQILFPDKYKAGNEQEEEATEKKLKATNNSLMGKYVQCFVCGAQDIPYWHLRSKSMMSKANTVGTMTYTKPTPGKDHCDYNLIQVIVCPHCFFASNDVNYFQSETNPQCPFDVDAFKKTWMENQSERQKKMEGKAKGFSSETRSEDQAILSYHYAIESHRNLAHLIEGYEHPRKIASLQMLQAELLMNTGEREAAENNLKQVLSGLEPVFTRMEGETIIRMASLLALIKLYFKDYQALSQYMGFLTNYDPEEKLAATSPEAKALKTALHTVKNAFENRKAYGYDKLETFHLAE